ncbi:MAG: glycoside hydrolase family 2 TIM barrel-domain containing protein [Phycisphaerae bacterium]
MALRERMSLNGWWDFLPDLSEEGTRHRQPGEIPDSGWLTGGILVPGSWTAGGCTPSDEDLKTKPWESWRLHDSYGYPAQWDKTCTAWYRRTFTLPGVEPGRRYMLHFGGVLRQAWYYLNGQCVGRSTDGIMPSTHDATASVRPGENVLHVFVTDYERNAEGKTFVPVGADQMASQKGIWQDVELETRPEVYVDDVTIRTSTRRNELTVIAAVCNASSRPRKVRPRFSVADTCGVGPWSFEAAELELAAGETRTVEVVQPWASYQAWTPNTPKLYLLETRLIEAGSVLDSQTERFGFREIWTEGHWLMLNGQPVHLSGEWRHNLHFDLYRPEYLRQWYGMLKDLNMNYIRTHTYPHAKVVLDLADEMGILVSLEAGWHFGNEHALHDDRLWQGSLQHIRNIVRRDKNHPSIILYSVGNECRWNADRPAIIANFPRLRKYYAEVDPTRIAYHDGDSSLWDEREQRLMSRHYGLECTGGRWWDRSRPLHVGELGKWHFGQPNDNLIFGDDSVFASFRQCHRAVALEAADVIQQARSNEVLCQFPWNLSGLDNYRPWPAERTFDWPDPAAPGLKPLRSAPYSSEFAWWEPESKGYSPGVSFDIIRHAFRPVALVVREKRNRFFADQKIRHTVTTINDSWGTVSGRVRVRLLAGGKVAWESAEEITLAHGYTHRSVFEVPLKGFRSVQDARVETTLLDTTHAYDRVERSVRIYPRKERTSAWSVGPIAVVGDGSMESVLAGHGVEVRRVGAISEVDVASAPVLLVERAAIQAGSMQHKDLEAFIRAGGRAVVLEQSASVMPQMQVDTRPSERVHIRGGRQDLLKGFEATDFEYWGDEPYGLRDSDSWVVVSPYCKPTAGDTRVLIESGWGDFGGGGMQWAPLVETRLGAGVLVACQLRVTDKAATHPAADRLLGAMLQYAASYQPAQTQPVAAIGQAGREELQKLGVAMESDGLLVAQGASLDAAGAAALVERARAGGKTLVIGLDPASAEALSAAAGVKIETVDLGTYYHLVRRKDDLLLDGIGNEETYWLDRCSYRSEKFVNRPMGQWLVRCEAGEELLVSEFDSCWREFFTQGASSEFLRMPVMTHYLWNGPREYAAGLMRIPVGAGELVICQVPLPADDYSKARTFWVRLMGNLGGKVAASLLEGEQVASGLKKGDGGPVEARYIADPSPEVLEGIAKFSRATQTELPNHALFNTFRWTLVKTPEGTLELPQDLQAREVVLFMHIRAGRPRKQAPVEGGLPDPSQQTLVDLTGAGEIRLVVNGHAYQVANLGEENKATIADIDLESDWNTVIFYWKPKGRTLKMLWHNRQGQPEVEFNFLWW